MKIALIGHGAMGKLIERLATEKGHEIGIVIDEADAGLSASELAQKIEGADVAIDFTTASAVRRNVEASVTAGVPLVEGTTGWNDSEDEIEKVVRDGDGAMVFAANFSIGVNLFYYIATLSAEVFERFPQYEVFIEEQHHSRKKDAPSGTALEIKRIVCEYSDKDLPIASTRAGNIPGTHRLGFDGPADQVLIQHMARSREGFAEGAIRAGEWIVGKKGFYGFQEVLEQIIAERSHDPKLEQ